MQKSLKKFFKMILGTAVASVALNVFLAPLGIAPGGISGLAIAINHLANIPIGTLIFALNIPVFLWGFKHFGKGFFLSSLAGMVFFSTFTDLLAFLPSLTNDILLSSVYGGVLLGLGIGLVFSAGFTTGGTDIVVQILRDKQGALSIGRLILIIDAFIIGLAGLIFKKWETVLYSGVSLYISSFIIDLIIEGGDLAKVAYIISDHPKSLALAISIGLSRGTTTLSASSFYTNTQKSVLMCVVKSYEITRLKSIIKETDSKAFVILSDAREVLGNGFKNY